ncbi:MULTISPECIES: hypothetical protein [unclassified Shigella]|uniref:hypothetical protein n=1 Tax=unclassified Shigella TaxID=2629414 RepID=UPI0008481E96|nr:MULTISPECIES: hypothetical protein [unclassified Shigella]ODQ08295.1 hypothetical protein BGK50_12085 [Shigella sp. FC130]OEI90050.1 hypothetical protein BHE86_11225 [Shigella sp. FC1655]OEJ08854.1 hypothetical protein BHE89_10415 [Shigella sp. FC1967]
MEKKNRPCGGGFDISNDIGNCPSIIPTSKRKRTPKKHRARLYMLGTGINGFTENEILIHCRLSSARNYASELERKLDITLDRIDEPNPDGIGSHYRYRFKTAQDVQKVINLINKRAEQGNYQPIDKALINNILSLYPTK